MTLKCDLQEYILELVMNAAGVNTRRAMTFIADYNDLQKALDELDDLERDAKAWRVHCANELVH